MIKIKITIDTKEDSHEEIRRIIKLLSSMIEEKEIYTNQESQDSTPTNQGDMFGGVFGDTPQTPKTDEKTEEAEEPEIMTYDLE